MPNSLTTMAVAITWTFSANLTCSLSVSFFAVFGKGNDSIMPLSCLILTINLAERGKTWLDLLSYLVN